jgi:RNA polymerase sigma-70 factor, ECF subfamily
VTSRRSEDHTTSTVLYRAWWPVVVDFAARRLRNLEEAEVIAQESLLRALEIAQREPVASFASLVLRIAHNLCVDRLRRSDWRAERTDPDDLAARVATDAAEYSNVRRAVDELHPELREIVELRYVDGRTFAEIATELSMSKNGVFARHQRALDALRRSLFPGGPNDPEPPKPAPPRRRS